MFDHPTVFLVDPDGPTRDAIRNLVYTMNLACEAYASGHDFLQAYTAPRSGCLISEVRIPGISGLEIQQRISAQDPTLPLIFLATQPTVSIAVRAMRAGALNLLEKPLRDHELWDAIEEAIRVNRERQGAWAREQECRRRLAQLKPAERDILQLMAEGRSKKWIATAIGVCTRTVEIRRTQVMSKLNASTLKELVQYALLAQEGDGNGDRVHAVAEE